MELVAEKGVVEALSITGGQKTGLPDPGPELLYQRPASTEAFFH